MIKMTVAELVNAYRILDRIVNQYESRSSAGQGEKEELPFETAYAIGRMLQKLEPEEINFTNEVNKLIIKYGTEDDKAGFKTITEKNPYWEKFLHDLSIIENEELEISGVYPIKFELMKNLKGISVKETLQLGKFIQMNDDERK